MATQREIADHIGLSERHVRNLVNDGIFTSGPNGLDVDKCRAAYIKYLRKLRNKRYERTGTGSLEDDFRLALGDIIGEQYVPSLLDMIFTGGVGMLRSEMGLSKSAAVEAALNLAVLIHHRTEECFGEVSVLYPASVLQLAAAKKAGNLDQWVREHWPDRAPA